MRGTARTSAWHPAQRSGELPRSVRQEAMLVLGQTVFGSSGWSAGKKSCSPCPSAKMLFLFNENEINELTAFYRAASLSNIYRFITQYHMTEGNLEIKERNQVAFFRHI